MVGANGVEALLANRAVSAQQHVCTEKGVRPKNIGGVCSPPQKAESLCDGVMRSRTSAKELSAQQERADASGRGSVHKHKPEALQPII